MRNFLFHHHHRTDEDRFCGCGQQHFLNCFVLSFAFPITEPINTRRFTGFSTVLCTPQTATERKREYLSSKPEIRRSNTPNAQHMDALVSFVLAGTMHAALPQLLEGTAKLASSAFEARGIEGIPPHMPMPPLLAAEAHPSRAKAGHIKCLAWK